MNVATLSLLILATPLIASAQSFNSCADVSVPVAITLTSELVSTVPSASIGMYAEMHNQSTSLISDASMAVDVVEKGTMHVTGRFVVPQHITILPQSSAKAGIIWKVPSEISSGTYTVIATLVPKNGTRAEAFAHVYPTARRDVEVKDGSVTPASIRSLHVNGNAYQPNSVARVASEGHVSAVVDATNNLSGPYKGTIEWKLYAPDAALEDAPIDTNTESVGLHPGTSGGLSYSLPTLTLSSYYLEGRLSDGKSNRYFDTLLAREDGAFAWTKCIAAPASTSGGAGSTEIVVSIIVAIITFGLILEFIHYRRA